MINFTQKTWNSLTKQFLIKPTTKSQQILQKVTYGENLVKDNSVAPPAKRQTNARKVDDWKH